MIWYKRLHSYQACKALFIFCLVFDSLSPDPQFSVNKSRPGLSCSVLDCRSNILLKQDLSSKFERWSTQEKEGRGESLLIDNCGSDCRNTTRCVSQITTAESGSKSKVRPRPRPGPPKNVASFKSPIRPQCHSFGLDDRSWR